MSEHFLTFIVLMSVLATVVVTATKDAERDRTIVEHLERLEPRVETVYIQQQVDRPDPCLAPPAPGDSLCLRDTLLNPPAGPWTTLEEYLNPPEPAP